MTTTLGGGKFTRLEQWQRLVLEGLGTDWENDEQRQKSQLASAGGRRGTIDNPGSNGP